MMLLTSTNALASYNSYMSPHVNMVKSDGTWQNINVAALKGTINVYTPQISSVSDHRDTFVYLFHVDKFTLGAGYYIRTVLVI